MAKPDVERQQDWRLMMALFSAIMFMDLIVYGHMVAFTPLFLKTELSIPLEEVPRWTGILAAAPLVIAVPTAPIWGIVADRYSRKGVILRTLVIQTVGFTLVALCTDVWQFLVIRTLLGFAYGSMSVILATQSMVTPSHRVGTALGVIVMSATAAQSIGPLLGSVVINTLGLRAMFALDAGLEMLAILLGALTLREPSYHDQTTPLGERLKIVFSQVATVPVIRWTFLCWLLAIGGSAAMDPYLPVLIDRLVGGVNSATVTGMLLAAYGVLTALGTPIFGRLTDRMGAPPLFLMAVLLSALIAGGVALATTLPILALLMLVRAIPQSGITVLLYSHLALHVDPKHRAAVMSLSPLPRNAGFFVGPALASVATGFGLSGPFWLAGGLSALAAFAAILLVKASALPRPIPRR